MSRKEPEKYVLTIFTRNYNYKRKVIKPSENLKRKLLPKHEQGIFQNGDKENIHMPRMCSGSIFGPFSQFDNNLNDNFKFNLIYAERSHLLS